MACAAAQRDFYFSSLVVPPLGLSFGFGPTSVFASPSGVYSPPRREGAIAVADWGSLTHSGQGGVWCPQLGCVLSASGSRDWQSVATDWDILTLVGVSPSACGGRDWCVGAVAALPLVHHSTVAPLFLG